MFNGLNSNMENIYLLSNAKSRSMNAENIDGSKGKAASAIPSEDSWSSTLGVGWKVSPYIAVMSGQTVCIADIDGSGAIQSMWFTGNITSDLVLRMYWDHQENPSVEVPLNAFFAYGFPDSVVNHFDGHFPVLNSLPVMVSPTIGLNCYWTMPFKKHCRITLENQGGENYGSFYQINYTLTDVPEDIAYFHASYRHALPVQNGLYTVIDNISGKGQYVGTALFANLNKDVDCWVEGEMKFYFDGDDEFPTITYTGTEDYFCGAYNFGRERANGKYNTYSAPYAGMFFVEDTKSPSVLNCDKFMAYRWHIADPIRFDCDLKVILQNIRFSPIDNKLMFRSDDFASVSYWYQTIPTVPLQPLPSAEERKMFQKSKHG